MQRNKPAVARVTTDDCELDAPSSSVQVSHQSSKFLFHFFNFLHCTIISATFSYISAVMKSNNSNFITFVLYGSATIQI